MFKSVDHALNVAYLSLIKTPYKSSSLFINSSNGEPVTWEDVATQAGMVFCVIREALRPDELALIDAWKITPETQRLEERKINSIMVIVNHLSKRINVDNEYLFVVVANYCGITPANSDEWWAKKLRTSTRTLRRLRNGTMRKHGINEMLDGQVKTITKRLRYRFSELLWLPT